MGVTFDKNSINGMSRSPAVVMSYLMLTQCMDPEKALEAVVKGRPQVSGKKFAKMLRAFYESDVLPAGSSAETKDKA